MASGTINISNRAITKTSSSYVTKFSGWLKNGVATISATVQGIPANTFTSVGTLDVKPKTDLVFPAINTTGNGVGMAIIYTNGSVSIYSANANLQFAISFVTDD